MAHRLWQPSAVADNHLIRFWHKVANDFQLELKTYDDLYQWSIQQPAKFWASVASYCQIQFLKTTDTVCLPDPRFTDRLRQIRWFPGAQLNYAENCLQGEDDKLACLYLREDGYQERLTFSALRQQVNACAAYLQAQGVQKGDRVAAILPNNLACLIAMLATARLGGIWSCCSPEYGEQAILDRFQQITPRIVLACDQHCYQGKRYSHYAKLSRLMASLDSVTQWVLVPFSAQEKSSSIPVGAVSWTQCLKTNPPSDWPYTPCDFADPLLILYSSGTTGKPKCIVHSVGGVLLQHLKEHQLHTNLHSTDRFFYHTSSSWMMWNWLVSGLASQACIVLYDGSPAYPTTDQLLRLVDAFAVTIFGTSAAYLASLAKAKLSPRATLALTHLTTLLSTGSPLLPEQYDYVYHDIKPDILLSSISGGTDICGCFALGNPTLPVYRGELQCRGLGMAVEVYNEQGQAVVGERGELVCTAAHPSQPLYFWNDTSGTLYHTAYFNRFKDVWAHGDFACLTDRGTVIIYGRADAVLNVGGIRIGTAEIYQHLAAIPEILDSVVTEQAWQAGSRMVLFIKCRPEITLDRALETRIKQRLREAASPRHVPDKIIQVPDIPRTISGKLVELAVKQVIHQQPVKNIDALANPEALAYFAGLHALQEP